MLKCYGFIALIAGVLIQKSIIEFGHRCVYTEDFTTASNAETETIVL